MRQLGTVDRLAQWRHRGFGPAYIKIGRKVLYCGVDLNSWIEVQRVEPSAA